MIYIYHSSIHLLQVLEIIIRLAWSFNGQPTINSADPAYAGAIGGAKGLSVLDSYQTNLLYGCGGGTSSIIMRMRKPKDCIYCYKAELEYVCYMFSYAFIYLHYYYLGNNLSCLSKLCFTDS